MYQLMVKDLDTDMWMPTTYAPREWFDAIDLLVTYTNKFPQRKYAIQTINQG